MQVAFRGSYLMISDPLTIGMLCMATWTGMKLVGGKRRGRRRAAAGLSTVGLVTILGSSLPAVTSAFVPVTDVSFQTPLKSQPIWTRDAEIRAQPIFQQKQSIRPSGCRSVVRYLS